MDTQKQGLLDLALHVSDLTSSDFVFALKGSTVAIKKLLLHHHLSLYDLHQCLAFLVKVYLEFDALLMP